MTLSPKEAVDTANATFGRHPGRRALHAKGTLLTGMFTATPEAARLTRAAHMQGQPVRATVRVSNGAGDPELPDWAPDVRGLAVKLHLPDGTTTDIVAQSAPRFPVHTPEAFVQLLDALRPGAARAWKLPRFLALHPDALPRLAASAPKLMPPASYATSSYYAVHAFRLIASDRSSRYVRYTWVPEAGEQRLSPRAAKRLGPHYLQQEIRERLAREPVRFGLQVQVAGPGDKIDDPAAAWPSERRRLRAGVLEITAVDTESEENALVFDPTRVTEGIELSNDPVLRFRPQAYSESVERRSE
jgi:catalase